MSTQIVDEQLEYVTMTSHQKVSLKSSSHIDLRLTSVGSEPPMRIYPKHDFKLLSNGEPPPPGDDDYHDESGIVFDRGSEVEYTQIASNDEPLSVKSVCNFMMTALRSEISVIEQQVFELFEEAVTKSEKEILLVESNVIALEVFRNVLKGRLEVFVDPTKIRAVKDTIADLAKLVNLAAELKKKAEIAKERLTNFIINKITSKSNDDKSCEVIARTVDKLMNSAEAERIKEAAFEASEVEPMFSRPSKKESNETLQVVDAYQTSQQPTHPQVVNSIPTIRNSQACPMPNALSVSDDDYSQQAPSFQQLPTIPPQQAYPKFWNEQPMCQKLENIKVKHKRKFTCKCDENLPKGAKKRRYGERNNVTLTEAWKDK